MRNFFLRLMVAFLLFSIAAETFSAAFLTSAEQVSFAEKEEQGKEDQKEKETSKYGEESDKWFHTTTFVSFNINQSPLLSGYLHPELINRHTAPPDMPPEQA